MTKTTNYQLNQWESHDRVLMDDFNSDNAKIDAALEAQKNATPKIAVGKYVGTGGFGAGSPNTLTFDFAPKLVAVATNDSYTLEQGNVFITGQTASSGIGAVSNSGASLGLTVAWPENGVSWYGGSADNQLNVSGTSYFYFAIG